MTALSSPPSPDEVSHFQSMLAEFRRLSVEPRGEADRFQFLCDQMFTVFSASGIWEADREHDRLLPGDDNLDTGNPAFHPPDVFMNTMVKLASDPENLRGYYGGFARDDLRSAVQEFLRRTGLLSADQTVDVVAGAGTVHLYDLLCRHLVRRPNDVVLSAHPFYGFFLPHAERSGGQTRLVRPDDGYRCSGSLVASSISAVNDELHQGWATTVGHRFRAFLTDAAPHLGLCVPPLWVEEVGRALDRVRTWPDFPEQCDGEVLDLLGPLLAEVGLPWPALARVGKLPTVPRVVAWMHINPSQGGDVYGQEHVSALAEVLRYAQVPPIEDLAYHSVRIQLGELGSFFRTGVPTYQLLGLSKPFGLANCRVGLLVTDTDDGYQLGRLVETSAGWMPTFHQIALRDLLADKEVERYLRENSSASQDSYAAKCTVALAVLRGRRHDPTLSEDGFAHVSRIADETAEELFGPFGSYPHAAGVPIRSLVDDFLADGLSAWLSVPRPPEAGFFVMADCTSLITSELGRALDLRSAFDVFALFTHFAGVRTIPEEAMTVASLSTDTKLLRLSFSVPSRTWVHACFLIFLLLRRLTEQTSHIDR
ncbi:aminotransferase class I/II-fold pyridoxal phosphate-dependent enzyme [Streptomyces sp. B21-105]|uniref:aminotransferase class I/II-fold pyridoxal phosphate-dependent enzyme n=1 Tax=Streptomyces sp. B21-105 TaxID=3039417 RepID=UPI002FF0AA75